MAIAKANNVGLAHQLRVGERVVIPGNGQRLALPAQPKVQPQVQAQPQPAPQPQKLAAARPEPTPGVKQQTKVQQVEPAANARVLTPAADPLPETPTGATGARHRCAELPLAGARPRHHGLRPEDERRTE
jgi:hypothetical protein